MKHNSKDIRLDFLISSIRTPKSYLNHCSTCKNRNIVWTIKKEEDGHMKYFFSTLVSLFSVLVLSSPAWAADGGKDKGVQLTVDVFANQFSTNNGVTTTTT